MKYNNFEILVEEKENGKYPVRAGNVNGFFELTGGIEKLKLNFDNE